jgi:hypothetical protein
MHSTEHTKHLLKFISYRWRIDKLKLCLAWQKQSQAGFREFILNINIPIIM